MRISKPWSRMGGCKHPRLGCTTPSNLLDSRVGFRMQQKTVSARTKARFVMVRINVKTRRAPKMEVEHSLQPEEPPIGPNRHASGCLEEKVDVYGYQYVALDCCWLGRSQYRTMFTSCLRGRSCLTRASHPSYDAT